MRRAEIITAFILGLFSVYLMWKSGEPPAWNPDAARFDNIGYDDTGAPGSGFWPFWLGVIMLASCVWTGINWALRRTPASVSTAPFLDSYGWKMLLTVGGGLIGFLLVIEFLGFYAAMLAAPHEEIEVESTLMKHRGGSPNNPYLQPTPMTYAHTCLLYTSPSPRDRSLSRMPSSA